MYPLHNEKLMLIMQVFFHDFFNIRLVVVTLLASWRDKPCGITAARWSVLNEEIDKDIAMTMLYFFIC